MALEALNKIKHFDTGGTTGQPATEAASDYAASDSTTDGVGAPVKSGAPPKGGISPVGTTVLNPKQTAELLNNMEQMIAQKSSPYAKLMSGVQDALAYAAPQAGNQRALALQYRNEQKRQEMQDIFSMREQMAALKASAQQAQAQSDWANKFMSGDTGTVGGGSSTVIGGGGSFNDLPPAAQARIMSVPEGPQRATMIQEELKKLGEFQSKAKYDAAWNAPTEVIGKSNQIIKVPLWQATELAMENPDNPKNKAIIKSASEISSPAPTTGGVNQFNVGNVRPAGKSTGFQQPSSYEEGIQIMDKNLQSYGQKGINTLRGVISRWAPPNENDTNALVKNAAQRLGIDPDQPIDLNNPVQRHLVGSALMLQEKGSKQLFAAAPTGTMTDVGGGAEPLRARPGESLDSFKQRQELHKKQQEKQMETDIATTAKSGEKIRADAGAMMGAALKHAENADDVIRTADRVIKHAMTRPDEFGYAYQQENPALATVAGIPGVGAIAEKTVPALFGNKGESGRRTDTDADSKKLGLDFAAQMFSGTGARLGVGLEQMAANAKGVGTELPANTNALNANLVKVAAQKAKDIASEWDKWSETHGGVNADPNKFIQSEEFKSLANKWDKKLVEFDKQLQKTFPDIYQPYKKPEAAENKNRKPLGQILGGQ